MTIAWHWKAALVSATSRASVFFVMNATAGLDAGLRAGAAEFAFRTVASGLFGAWTQSLSRVDPPAAGVAAALLLLPAIAHTSEYVWHLAVGTPRLAASVTASIGFTCVSTAFNVFAMRRGVLVVGERGRPLRDDLMQLPGMARLFVATAREQLGVAVGCCRRRGGGGRCA